MAEKCQGFCAARESAGTHSFPHGCLPYIWLQKESLSALHLGLLCFQWIRHISAPSIWLLTLPYSSNASPPAAFTGQSSTAQDPSPHRDSLGIFWISSCPHSLTSPRSFQLIWYLSDLSFFPFLLLSFPFFPLFFLPSIHLFIYMYNLYTFVYVCVSSLSVCMLEYTCLCWYICIY